MTGKDSFIDFRALRKRSMFFEFCKCGKGEVIFEISSFLFMSFFFALMGFRSVAKVYEIFKGKYLI